MKNINIKFCTSTIVILINFICKCTYPGNPAHFEDGIKAYHQKNYTAAINHFKKMELNGQITPDLYYNIGTSYLQMDSIAQAIYYMEKCKKYSPTHANNNNNLQIAREKTIDRIQEFPQLFFVKWYYKILHTFNANTWAWISLFCLIDGIILFILLKKYSNRITKWIVYLLYASVIFMFFFSIIAANTRLEYEQSMKQGIVYTNKIIGRAQAFDNAEENFILHEGAKVAILNTENGWHNVRIADGREGYLPIAAVRLY